MRASMRIRRAVLDRPPGYGAILALAGSPSLPSPAVYIIDNDEGFRRSLQFALTAEGYSCRGFESGDQFIGAVSGLIPGVVIVDLGMPGLDGMSILARIRAMRWPFRPIVVTGHLDSDLKAQAAALGAGGYLIKPFPMNELLAQLAQG